MVLLQNNVEIQQYQKELMNKKELELIKMAQLNDIRCYNYDNLIQHSNNK